MGKTSNLHDAARVLIYDFFEVTDILFLPHTAWLAAVLRLSVFSPMMLGILFAYRRRLPFWLLEGAAVAITVMMMVETLVVFWLNSGVKADVYTPHLRRYGAISARPKPAVCPAVPYILAASTDEGGERIGMRVKVDADR